MTPIASAKAQQMIARHAEEGSSLRIAFFRQQTDKIEECAKQIAMAIARGHKLMLCGNGGSAADAQHLAAEFVNRFLIDRPPLPAIALSTDTSALTAIGNDFGFEQLFARQVMALGMPGDVLLALSTSGTSPNVLAALETARKKSMLCFGLCGNGHGMDDLCDLVISVPHSSTPLVQEMHISAGHMLCALVDHFLFEDVMTILPGLKTDRDFQE